MIIEYSSNNSGGYWWLSDDKWKALEAAGWSVEWKDGRWLGALATSARVDATSLSAAIKTWECITGLDATAEGCNCCGAPHSFKWGCAVDECDCNGPHKDYGYVSGSEIVGVLYGSGAPSSLREAAERLAK